MQPDELEQIADQHAHMLRYAIMERHKDKALAVVERAFMMIAESESVSLDDSVAAIIHYRIAPHLQNAGVMTIRQLCEESLQSVAMMPRLHYRTANMIRESLQKHGWDLRGTDVDVIND